MNYINEDKDQIVRDASYLLDMVKLRIQRFIKAEVILNNEAIVPPEDDTIKDPQDVFNDKILDLISHLERQHKQKEDNPEPSVAEVPKIVVTEVSASAVAEVNIVEESEAQTEKVIEQTQEVKLSKRQKMEKSVGKPLAVSMLMSTTRKDFNNIRKQILETYQLQDHDIPTFYYITKERPNMEKGEMDSILEAYSILTREFKLNQATLDKSETVKNKIEKRFFCKIKSSLADLLVLLLEKCERLFGKDF